MQSKTRLWFNLQNTLKDCGVQKVSKGRRTISLILASFYNNLQNNALRSIQNCHCFVNSYLIENIELTVAYCLPNKMTYGINANKIVNCLTFRPQLKGIHNHVHMCCVVFLFTRKTLLGSKRQAFNLCVQLRSC